jgi:FixJ family two-component response regulator
VSAPQIVSIVDDDESVRAAMIRLVRSLGFVTCSFASARDFSSVATLEGYGMSDFRRAIARHERA